MRCLPLISEQPRASRAYGGVQRMRHNRRYKKESGEMNTERDFASLLDHYLWKREVSARKLAKWLDVDLSTVSRWRSGVTRPRDLERVEKIAQLLRIPEGAERYAFARAAGFAVPPHTATRASRAEAGAEGEESPATANQSLLVPTPTRDKEDRLNARPSHPSEYATLERTMQAASVMAGALAAGASEGGTRAMKNLYTDLRGGVLHHFAGNASAEQLLAAYEMAPSAWQEQLENALIETGAAHDDALIGIAEQLMKLASSQQPSTGKYNVQIREARGTAIGDNAKVIFGRGEEF
jgi:transcriptional regulator with XRE-family HTH domain